MKAWLGSWRLALRLARRDLLKHKARAIIALVMVTLPVLGVVAADVLIQTQRVSPTEGISRRLGAEAAARIQIVDRQHAVIQGADPQKAWSLTDRKVAAPATVGAIERVVGRRTLMPIETGTDILVRTVHGREPMTADQVDASAALAQGLYRLTSGHWPTTKGEVVVNQAVRDRGVGDTLEVVGRDRVETPHAIVGTIVDASRRSDPVVVGQPGSFPALADDLGDASDQSWLVSGAPITWSQITQLNDLGVLVTDRQVASHPADYPNPLAGGHGLGDDTVNVAVLIVVMALIEVVLLAGPAFAVGARKQQRSLALMVSAGGTPGQSRRVILAGGLLLGLTAGVVGVVGGIGAAWVLEPLVQRFSRDWFGPFQVVWPHVLAVAAFGLVSALIACVVPAWIASRQNVVAVLAGRRGDAKPMRAFPVIGLALFAVGVLVAVKGAREPGDGSLTIAWSAVICVLGMVLLVPVVVSWVARVARRLPLSVRFAARDAVRHRTRTTPAIAAVAATVAGVVALGISTASDEKQNRETYQARLVMGDALVEPSYDFVDSDPGYRVDWSKIAATVRQHVPGARITSVVGAEQESSDGSYPSVSFQDPAEHGARAQIQAVDVSAGLGDSVLVSDGQLPPTASAGIRPGDQVQTALAAGRAVVFTNTASQARLSTVRLHVDATDAKGRVTPGKTLTVPARVVFRSADSTEPPPVQAILPRTIADRAGLTPATVALELDQPHLSGTAERDLSAALDDLATPAAIYVERGYVTGTNTFILELVLAVLAAVLMLGGTLTAMFLALSDSRPDLATLAAVGAAPRTRRSVAAAYTFVVAFVGSVLGMLVGFVPGLAITRPLTRIAASGRTAYFLDVPWLLITVVVVGLPILTAVVVGACTRSRLPMVSRLS